MKEIKDNLNKWKDTPCLMIGSLNIIKMSVLYNSIDTIKFQWKFHVILWLSGTSNSLLVEMQISTAT
jgi:hypothetical protein